MPQGTCDCGVPYVPAHVAAAKAVAEHPEQSDRAIAKATGIPRATIQRARTGSTGPNEPVKRIGLDGKSRRLPQQHSNPSPEVEQQYLPVANALVANLWSVMNAIRTESKQRAMSPVKICELAHNLRSLIDASLSPELRAYVCMRTAKEWKIDETISETTIDNVRKAVQAWGDLLEKLEDSSGVADSPVVSDSNDPVQPIQRKAPCDVLDENNRLRSIYAS
jgi:hypothetical protein